MKSSSQDVKALFFLITLVGILAIPTARSFLPPQSDRLATAALSATASSSSRAPSSVKAGKLSQNKNASEVSHSKEDAENRSIVINYDCRKNDEIVVDARLLRLKSKRLNCTEDVSTANDKWLLKNQSNGFTGTLIVHQNGFTTDYIELREGSNQIQLTLEDSHGQKFEKLIKVLRRSVASVNAE